MLDVINVSTAHTPLFARNYAPADELITRGSTICILMQNYLDKTYLLQGAPKRIGARVDFIKST